MKAFWHKIKKAKMRIASIAVITVLFGFFQNCTMSSLSGNVGDVSSASQAPPGAYGVSPTSVQLAWNGIATSTSYNIYNLDQGSAIVQSTSFTVSTVSSLTANTNYTFSIRGSRGTGDYLTDPLGTYAVTTWPDFSAVTFTTSAETNGSTTIAWNYAPWSTTTLAATPSAQAGATISCAMLPVPAGTDPTTVNPTTPGNGVTPITVTGPLFPQSLPLPLGQIDVSLTYAVQCTAKFLDGTSSASTQNFLLSPTNNVSACPTTGLVGSSYVCSPNITVPSATESQAYTIGLDTTNTCTWASIAGNTLRSTSSLTAANIGSCNLVYRYSLPQLSYTSPAISQKVTVSVPATYHTFPSFAVRAMSGAIAFPHLYATLTGHTDTRAMVSSDIISDFGYGTSFFAGGSNPFPTFNPSAPAITSNFFYSFPVSTTVNGVQPTGYSLDAIRSTWQSSSPAEGYIRGNLIIPAVQVTNSAFLAATGTTSASSLYDFLTNVYTYNGGSNFAPAALSYYLNTIADRDVSGNAYSSTWNGSVYEQGGVTFNIPTAQTISSFVPSSGVNGSTTLLTNVDTTKTVTGLISSSANNSLYYVANCQANPTLYTNPAGCTPSGGAALPTTISCLGDVIVQAPLLLVNPVIVTDGNGCRIHATGTIFVQGPITALNADGTANSAPIEFMSSRAVIFGFSDGSLGVTNAGTRTNGAGGILDQTIANGTTNPYLTSVYSGPGSASAALNAIAVDAQVVNLKATDATDALATGSTAFNHVVVCAPYVFSNYSGLFTGSLTAEVTAFPYLNFAADSTLVGVTPFPLFTGSNKTLIVTAPQ